MINFVSRVIGRQLETTSAIKPRLPGKFEPVQANRPSAPDIGDEQIQSQMSEPIKNAGIGNQAGNGAAKAPASEHHRSIENPQQAFRNYQSDQSATIDGTDQAEIPVKQMFIEEPNFNLTPSPDVTTLNVATKYKEQRGRAGNSAIDYPTFVETPPVRATTTSTPSTNGEIPQQRLVDHLPGEVMNFVLPVASASAAFRRETVVGSHQSEPVIKVSIGRIEVRAVTGAKTSQVTKNEAGKPRMSLDDYLRKRDNRDR